MIQRSNDRLKPSKISWKNEAATKQPSINYLNKTSSGYPKYEKFKIMNEKLDEPNKNISYAPLTADSLNEQTLFYTIPVRVTNRSLKNSPYFFLNRRKLDIATYHRPRVLTSIQMNKPGPSVPKQIPRCVVLKFLVA